MEGRTAGASENEPQRDRRQRQELASGRDLVALRQHLGGAARITYGGGAEDSEFERTGLTEWNFGDLPSR